MALRYMRQFLASEAFENAGREVSDVIPRLVKFVCCLQVTNTHLLTVALCYGPSMILTIGLAGAWLNDPFDRISVEDTVMVRSPEVPWKAITKRLICIAWEEDPNAGVALTYVVDPKNSDRSETSVVFPQGHVWVEGDSIYDSHDSRSFGPVPFSLI
ncbi:mitochondrial ATP-independent inner membrane protease subunit 1a-like [Pyrus communis]|uniref:mitochondrial ATP-independent inner membrane protease subunit 1a-like n=1 Tax=Pyrus communis TaxID=23211 RepID=UPI0035C1DABD